MRLIGLNGRAGAGKDAVCGFIKEWGEQIGLTVKREAFADRLKLSAARTFHPDIELEDAVVWCNEIKEFGTLTIISESDVGRHAESITGREWLQRYGTECHREVFGQDFWIDAALKPTRADILVVTDVRFSNEAMAIQMNGGDVWEILRPGHQLTDQAHASEQALDSELIDVVVSNASSLGQLREHVFILLGEMVSGMRPPAV